MPPRAAKQEPKPKREPKVWTRYRARVTRPATATDTMLTRPDGTIPSTIEWRGRSHRKQNDAIKEGIDYALRYGIVAIEEVPMVRKLAATYQEVET